MHLRTATFLATLAWSGTGWAAMPPAPAESAPASRPAPPESLPTGAAALAGSAESAPASSGIEIAPTPKKDVKAAGPMKSLKDAVVIDPPVASSAPGEKRFVELRGKAVSAALGAALGVRLASAREAPGISLGLARLLFDVKAEELLGLSLHLQLELNPLSNEVLGVPPGFLPAPQKIFPLADAYILFSLASAAVGNLGYLKIGQFKAPFSAEALRDESNLITAERAWAVRALAPMRDVGVAYGSDFHGYGIPVAAEVGVFNGAGPSSVEELENLLGAARIFGHVGPENLRNKLRFEYGLSWSMEASRLDPLDGEVDAATVFGGDLFLRWRWFSVAAEVVVGNTDSLNRGFEAYGGYALGAIQIIPDFLEIIGRYERFWADIPLIRSGVLRPAWRATAGLNLYYLEERFRLQYAFLYGDPGLGPIADVTIEHVVLFTIQM